MYDIELIKHNIKLDKNTTNHVDVVAAVARVVKPNNVLEIGSYHFASANAMAKIMDQNKATGVIDSFDIRVGGYDGKTIGPKNSRIRAHYWRPHKTRTDKFKYEHAYYLDFQNMTNDEIFEKNVEYLKSIAPESGYDMIYIDGDHSYIGVSYDWEYAQVVANENTVVVFDDLYVRCHPGVEKFWKELKCPKGNKWDFKGYKCHTGVVVL